MSSFKSKFQSISEVIEGLVQLYPDRFVLKSKTSALTWDALNRTANRLARDIIQVGEGEAPIALFLDRGLSILTSIVAVLKAGKFYVPLDPSHPLTRNRYIIEDSGAALILTDSRNLSAAKQMSFNGRANLVNIDELDSNLSAENLALSIPSSALANIVYTSGSTGQPKGVVNTQETVLQRGLGDKHFHISAEDRITAAGSAGRDIFTSLLNGAGSFPWNVKEQGLVGLSDWLMQEEITILRCVPSVFRHFASTLNEEGMFPKLRVILLTGEPVYSSDVELYKKHFSSGCVLVNNLSSTESGSFRQYIIDKETAITSNIVPVGYALEDKDVLLMDDNGQQVSFNEVGEIAVKSRYLSPGYWRKPELTKAKFLCDPDGTNERIYLTGDLGRLMQNGCLEHLGRKDFQVKVRGLRIELSEVEGALLSMSEISEAVVTVHERSPGEKFLVAYIVSAKEPKPAISEIRRFMEQKLPAFMVPSSYIMLETLPLTPNDKIDRRALPAPDRSRPDLDTPFAAPRTYTEKALARIWEDVLGIDNVGIDDSFLSLGGNSLLATQVISRMLTEFQVDIPMRSFLETPTVAKMGVVIIQNLAGEMQHQQLAVTLNHIESLSEEEALTRGEEAQRSKTQTETPIE